MSELSPRHRAEISEEQKVSEVVEYFRYAFRYESEVGPDGVWGGAYGVRNAAIAYDESVEMYGLSVTLQALDEL